MPAGVTRSRPTSWSGTRSDRSPGSADRAVWAGPGGGGLPALRLPAPQANLDGKRTRELRAPSSWTSQNAVLRSSQNCFEGPELPLEKDFRDHALLKQQSAPVTGASGRPRSSSIGGCCALCSSSFTLQKRCRSRERCFARPAVPGTADLLRGWYYRSRMLSRNPDRATAAMRSPRWSIR